MKLSHQSLPYLVPHRIWGNSQEIFKSQLSQKLGIPLVDLRSKHQPEKSGIGSPTLDLVSTLHSKSEAIR